MIAALTNPYMQRSGSPVVAQSVDLKCFQHFQFGHGAIIVVVLLHIRGSTIAVDSDTQD